MRKTKYLMALGMLLSIVFLAKAQAQAIVCPENTELNITAAFEASTDTVYECLDNKGLTQGPFQQIINKSGKPRIIANYKNSKFFGDYKSFREDGSLDYIASYNANGIVDEFKKFDKTGKLSFTNLFENGIFVYGKKYEYETVNGKTVTKIFRFDYKTKKLIGTINHDFQQEYMPEIPTDGGVGKTD